MLTRRELIQLGIQAGAAAALLPAACTRAPEDAAEIWVNDIHSQLNRTRVMRIEKPTTLKALQIRPESWKERTVAGRPGLSVVGDFMEKKHKKVGYAVFVPGKTHTAAFTLIVAAKDFEACKPNFEAIVDSYKEN